MIKTLTYTEQKFLRLILPTYYRHLTRHPHTFLTHFYGLYRVCMPNADNTRLHFVIMRSVFHTEKKIDRVWDLKGSTVGRKSNKGESVLKDLDILEEGKKLRFRNGSEREAFLKQLEIDAAFLATMGIMDYSLLLGLHNESDCEDGCCSSGVTGGGGGVDQVTPNQSETGDSPTTAANQVSSDPPPLPMTNTPHRRNVLMRKAINGSSPPKQPSQPKGGRSSPMKTATALPSSSSSSNPITSMSDLGIQGGTSLRPETYYCGIIDILQYYNARKMGETVIKKAAGGDADNISCVDPETYGKRFVKFISDLVE
jgi:1-phosphatidylinositol-4-phosphate 5-kinase